MKKVVKGITLALSFILMIGIMISLGGCIINNGGVSPPPPEAAKVSAEELDQFLWETFPWSDYNHLPDSVYFLSGIADLEKFLATDNLNQYQYHEEWFDCDEFSVVLKGRAAEKGITLGIIGILDLNEAGEYEGHQFNLFITKEEGELRAYLVEPQSDEVWLVKEEERVMASFIIF